MANRYFLATDTNWNNTANWSTTDLGAGGSLTPTAADDVFFTANSGACTMNIAGVAKSVTFTGYIKTITMTSGLTVSGNVTLGSSMLISGAGTLAILTTATLTSNGKVWGNNLTLGTGTYTTTFADPWDVGTFSTPSAGTRTINGSTLTVRAGMTLGSFTGGTTNIIMAGTGNFSGAGNLTSNLTINTTGTITLNNTGTIDKNFTYIAGTVVTTGNTAIFSGSAQTIDCGLAPNNMSFNHVSFQVSTSMTLLNDLMVGGNFTLSSVGASTKPVNGFNVRVKGNLALGSNIGGTTKLIMEGLAGSNVTWSGNFLISTDFTINSLGTVNVSGIVQFGAVGKTLKYQAGNVVTGTSELDCGQGSAIDTNGIVWNIVNLFSATVGAITTLASDLTCATFQNTSAAHVLNGSNLYCTNLTPTTNLSGTTNIIMNGGGVGTNGTWSGAGGVSNNLTLNTVGNIIISGTVNYNTGTLKYIAGAGTVNTSLSTLTITGNAILDTNGIAWNNITISPSSGIYIILSPLLVNNTIFLPGGTCSFSGSTAGFTANTVNINASTIAGAYTFVSGLTYRITNELRGTNTNGGSKMIKSSVAGQKAIITLDSGAACNVGYVDFTDIDASGGRAINSFNGAITNCNNVFGYIDPVRSIAKSYAA